MNEPKLNELVHNAGGNIYVFQIISDSLIVASTGQVSILCRVVRHNRQLWAY